MSEIALQYSRVSPYADRRTESPVRVYTEWDPLEEVIVGVIDDAHVPQWHETLDAVLPNGTKSFFRENQGKPFPAERVTSARQELEGFARLLQREGVKVVRPDAIPVGKGFSTPDWSVPNGFYHAMPRDCLFAIGDLVIEVPMAWRNRYFETFAFRGLLKDYFNRGARWIAAPKPTLRDELYRKDYDPGAPRFDSVLTEYEPVFDAADFIKVGRDIVGQLSHVTNWAGVEWLRRHLGNEYRVHVYEFDDAYPMHIDTTILPLAPGKVLVTKPWVSRLPDVFRDWEILTPPESVIPADHPLYMTSRWISVNVLMLDAKRVVVEAAEEPLIGAFKRWGFEPIPCPFRNFQSFGGSFHCATLDVRRSGELETYVGR